MCDFLSAIVFKDGKIFCAPEHTDSHSLLIAAKGLRDESLYLRGWIRVEFKPDSPEDYIDPDKYKLHVDESSTPEWFDSAAQFEATEELRDKIRSMIVTDERPILLGGCWILTGEANVEQALNARIYRMTGSSQLHRMTGSSQLHCMTGSSQLHRMTGSSQLHRMTGSSQLHWMDGSSQLHCMTGSSQLHRMDGSSQLHRMTGSSQLHWMDGDAQLHNDYRIKKSETSDLLIATADQSGSGLG